MDAVVDFVDDDEVVVGRGQNVLEGVHFLCQGSLHRGNVFRDVFGARQDPVLFDVSVGETGVKGGTEREFAGLPAGLHHAQVVHVKPATECAQHESHGGGALALTLAGVDLERPVFQPMPLGLRVGVFGGFVCRRRGGSGVGGGHARRAIAEMRMRTARVARQRFHIQSRASRMLAAVGGFPSGLKMGPSTGSPL